MLSNIVLVSAAQQRESVIILYMYIYIHNCIYTWASVVAQLVKNPPVMWETWVRSLG